MKKLLLLIVSGIVSTTGFASSTVCSGEQLYSSNVRFDSGIAPYPGKVTGTHVIVYDRKILLSYDTVEGLHPHGVAPYQVRFEGPRDILAEDLGRAETKRVFSVMAVVERVDPMTHKFIEEVGREQVVCREHFKFVP